MFCKRRRGNRCLCGQNEILGCRSALSLGPCWAAASSGESQKLLWLGCRRKETSPMERKGSHRAAASWCPRLGPNRPADRFPWRQGSWRGEGTTRRLLCLLASCWACSMGSLWMRGKRRERYWCPRLPPQLAVCCD